MVPLPLVLFEDLAPDELENDWAIEDGDGNTLFLAFDGVGCVREGEEVDGPVPDDPALETVSNESVPTSIEEFGLPAPKPIGNGGTKSSPGAASIPFFLADFGNLAEDEDPPKEKRPFALGADATRRMKRVMDFGVSRELE